MDGEIERIEQEILRLKGELVKARRAAPAESVSDYTFVGPGGETVPLSSLFGDKRDLLVVHNMGRECPYCSLWADSMNGMLKHIQERTAFVLDSPDDWQTQQRFAQERGWKFAMVSSPDACAEGEPANTPLHPSRHISPAYAVSQRKRKPIEELFGWSKTVGGLARPM